MPAGVARDESASEAVHLTSDMMHVDVEGHRQHAVARLFCTAIGPGVVAVQSAICSCGTVFELSALPKPKRQ